MKSKTPKFKQTDVIYSIPCNDCDKIYIGQTTQHLSDRINGHKYAKNPTALTNHRKNEKHDFDYNNTQILAIEKKQKKREILEMIYIQKNIEKSINHRTDIKNFSSIYFPILNIDGLS